MVYGYARCSTNDSKQDINRQIRDLKAMGAKKVYHEYATGTDPNRPQFQTLKNSIKPGDTIIATELSRFTRSVHHLCHLIEWAAHQHITLKAGTLTIDCSNSLDPMLEGMILMMGIFSQLERKLTIQRVKSGVANAKAKGIRLGRPPVTKKDLPQTFLDYYPTYQAGSITKAEYARLCSLSRPTLYRYLDIIANK